MADPLVVCTNVTVEQLRDIDFFKGALTRREWLAQLITLRLGQLNDLALREYGKTGTESFREFVGTVVQDLPRTVYRAVDHESARRRASETREQRKLARANPDIEADSQREVYTHPPGPASKNEHPGAHEHEWGIQIAASGHLARYMCDCGAISGWR